jgi:hypothetical protein
VTYILHIVVETLEILVEASFGAPCFSSSTPCATICRVVCISCVARLNMTRATLTTMEQLLCVWGRGLTASWESEEAVTLPGS